MEKYLEAFYTVEMLNSFRIKQDWLNYYKIMEMELYYFHTYSDAFYIEDRWYFWGIDWKKNFLWWDLKFKVAAPWVVYHHRMCEDEMSLLFTSYFYWLFFFKALASVTMPVYISYFPFNFLTIIPQALLYPLFIIQDPYFKTSFIYFILST